MFALGISSSEKLIPRAVGNNNTSKCSDKKSKRSARLGYVKGVPRGGGKARSGRIIAGGGGDKSNMICLIRNPRNQVDSIYEEKLQIERPMGAKSCNSYKYKNLFAAKTAPLIFIAVCYLIVANIRCDQVGSTNDIMSLMQPVKAEAVSGQEEQKKESSEMVEGNNEQSNDDTISLGTSTAKLDESNGAPNGVNSNGKKEPFDPMSFLREIYLDQNSKIITVLSPYSDSVQKFHPNGRYGRRSVSGTAPDGGHMELGKLRFIDDSSINNENNKDPLKSLLYNLINNKSKSSITLDEQQLSPRVANRRSLASNDEFGDLKQLIGSATRRSSGSSSLGDSSAADLETELSKILKCNFTGLAYLYWCNSAT